jgi:hypothetical protein
MTAFLQEREKQIITKGNIHENFEFPHRRIKIWEDTLRFYLKLLTFAE